MSETMNETMDETIDETVSEPRAEETHETMNEPTNVNQTTESLRQEAIDQAKKFKTAWVDMGRMLYTIYKDKSWRDWGYEKFEHYAMKEIGIKKQTSLKLLKSYFFLEKDEPSYLHKDFIKQSPASQVPDYETIDILRQAKNKKELKPEDYSQIKQKAFESGNDAKEVKKELTSLIKQREVKDPEVVKEQKRTSTIRRFIGILKSLKEEMGYNDMLPKKTIHEVETLLGELEERV